MDPDSPTSESARLEGLWAGEFGEAYRIRNDRAAEGREDFWSEIIGAIEPQNVLEVGCNVGGNLTWIAGLLESDRVAGVDINANALQVLRERIPGVDARQASAAALPFADDAFDLAFTCNVLIHLPADALAATMDEIVRCSRRYVLCGEYAAPEETEVPYRGERGALFKRDYGQKYLTRHPELTLVEERFEAKADGAFDDTTFWLFELG